MDGLTSQIQWQETAVAQHLNMPSACDSVYSAQTGMYSVRTPVQHILPHVDMHSTRIRRVKPLIATDEHGCNWHRATGGMDLRLHFVSPLALGPAPSIDALLDQDKCPSFARACRSLTFLMLLTFSISPTCLGQGYFRLQP